MRNMALAQLLGLQCTRLATKQYALSAGMPLTSFGIRRQQYASPSTPLLRTLSRAVLRSGRANREVDDEEQKLRLLRMREIRDKAKGTGGDELPNPDDDPDKQKKGKNRVSAGVLSSLSLTDLLNPVALFHKLTVEACLYVLRDWEPNFDPDEFLEGARHAIFVVTDLFSAKDAESMKRIMSPRMQSVCATVLNEYRDKQVPFSIELLDIMSCKLSQARIYDDDEGHSVIHLVVSYQVRERYNTGDSQSEFGGSIARPYLYTFERRINKLHPDDEKRDEFDYRWLITQIL